MNISMRKVSFAIPAIVVSAALVLFFQNCSQNSFKADEGSSSLESSSLDPKTNTAEVDNVTPRIVMSDSLNGRPMTTFSPKQTIYGTVYGVGENDVQVCVGVDNYCISKPKDIYNYNKPTSSLPNWAYNKADKTWRFTLSYAEVGDMLQKISIHDLSAKALTGLEFSSLHMERYFFVKSKEEDAAIYFMTSTMTLFGSGSKPDNIFRYGDSFVPKIAGLPAENLYFCIELVGSGRCNTESNWLPGNTSNGFVYDATAGVVNVNAILSKVPASSGTFDMYAKNYGGNTVARGRFSIQNKQIICAMRSNTPVFGPCSDSERSTPCSQSNVGQTVQGTGSCKVTYTCTCE